MGRWRDWGPLPHSPHVRTHSTYEYGQGPCVPRPSLRSSRTDQDGMGFRDHQLLQGRHQRNTGLTRHPLTILPNCSSPSIVHRRFLMESSATGNFGLHPLEVVLLTVILDTSSNEGCPSGSSTVDPSP